MIEKKHVVIIGAGLSGLTLSYLLHQENIGVTILEASSRIGGRILTRIGTLGTPLELGATWLSDLHPNLQKLLEELELQKFHQFATGISFFQTKSFEPAQQFKVPESSAPSYRIGGGTGRLIDVLSSKIDVSQVILNKKVVAIEDQGSTILVNTNDGDRISADIVVCCMPPQLLSSSINFTPQLPLSVKELLPSVQTWMAGSVKFVLEYRSPFWRENGFSGMLYSHAGLIMEMYDHTSIDGSSFGFTGFLNPAAAGYSKEVREKYILNQLADLMGQEVREHYLYEDMVWNGEFVLAGNPIIHRPHQNNGHPLLQEAYFNDKFHFCGTETATAHAGYMEGAIVAAQTVAGRILKL